MLSKLLKKFGFCKCPELVDVWIEETTTKETSYRSYSSYSNYNSNTTTNTCKQLVQIKSTMNSVLLPDGLHYECINQKGILVWINEKDLIFHSGFVHKCF